MQIRIIIEHKYYSLTKKNLQLSWRKKRGSFGIYFYKSREKHQISRTLPRLRVIGKINTGGQGINKKIIEQEEERGGPAVIRKKRRDRDLDSYRVRYSKHSLMSCFKVDYELMPGC